MCSVSEINMMDLCRICSVPASHSIFKTIPPYLHENVKETSRWREPIFRMVQDIIGLNISENDGLPSGICILCISYLKHAYTFRKQARNNIASLKEAITLSQSTSDKAKSDGSSLSVILTDPPKHTLNCNDKNVNDKIKTIDKKTYGNNSTATETKTVMKPVIDSEISHFFNYTQKSFEEDDITTLEIFKNGSIEFIDPYKHKERKCPSCRKRFMFEESLESHLQQCINFKLVKFIKEVYHLLFLKENRAITNYEFIRRVVFAIRKSNQILDSYDGETEPTRIVAESPKVIINFENLSISSKSSSPVKFVEAQKDTNINNEKIVLSLPSTPQRIDLIKNNLESDNLKMIKCSKCDQKFLTITHLDEHVIKMHSAKKDNLKGRNVESQRRSLDSDYFYNMENWRNMM